MRSGSRRHPILEIAVFTAALLLAGFVAREAWRRRAPAPAPLAPAAAGTPLLPQLIAEHPPYPASLSRPRTERGVTDVPPIKLSRALRRKPKPAVVPAPR